MTPDEIRDVVLRTLARFAPEADLARIPPEANLRDELDLDSMDFLNFATALHEELQVEIAEADYPKLMTLAGCIDYLAAARAAMS